MPSRAYLLSLYKKKVTNQSSDFLVTFVLIISWLEVGPLPANLALSVLCVFSQIGPGRPWDGPFYAKNAEFCVKCPFGRLWWTFKIGLPTTWGRILELKRLIFF